MLALGEGSGMCGSQRLQKYVRKVFLWPETAKPPATCRPHSPAESTEVGLWKHVKKSYYGPQNSW